MKLKLLASVAVAGLFAAGAASAEPNGWYGAIDAGYHMIDDINAESSTTGANWNYEVNDGWAAFARLGYRFNPNWRVELEGGYRSGDIGTVRAVSGTQGLCNLTPATGGCFSPEGDIKSATLMANVIYDFGYEAWGIRPFVGLGAGVNRVTTDTNGNLRANRGATFTADDDSTKFAAQAISGLAWAVGDRTNIDLTYRYLTGDASFASTTVGTGVGAAVGSCTPARSTSTRCPSRSISDAPRLSSTPATPSTTSTVALPPPATVTRTRTRTSRARTTQVGVRIDTARPPAADAIRRTVPNRAWMFVCPGPSTSMDAWALPSAVRIDPAASSTRALALNPVRRPSPSPSGRGSFPAGRQLSEPAERTWTRPVASRRTAARAEPAAALRSAANAKTLTGGIPISLAPAPPQRASVLLQGSAVFYGRILATRTVQPVLSRVPTYFSMNSQAAASSLSVSTS